MTLDQMRHIMASLRSLSHVGDMMASRYTQENEAATPLDRQLLRATQQAVEELQMCVAHESTARAALLKRRAQ